MAGVSGGMGGESLARMTDETRQLLGVVERQHSCHATFARIVAVRETF